MKLTLPVVMSLNAGYVDTAGFLALQGLFTAHVTGNFVTLGAALVLGSSGIVAKLLALPVFCIVIVGARLCSFAIERRGGSALRAMLIAKFVLLVIGAVLAIRLGPFRSGDGLDAIVTGMVLVAAMAIQNAASRVHLGTAPPTTLMTGTTTQMMIDLADLLRGLGPDARRAARARFATMGAHVVGFAAGCAGGALLFHVAGSGCFVLPPVLAFAMLVMPAPVPPAPRAPA